MNRVKGYAKCPASCGEYVQGMIGNEEYLCSYAVNLFSEVYLEERNDGEEEDLTERVKGTEKKIYIRNVKKSRLAIRKVFEKYDIPVETLNNLSVKIISEVPVSKGMGSSTADIGAAIGAALNLIVEKMTPEEIAEIASSIEPTDSFEKYDIPVETLNNLSVKIISEVPVSKGMGSSTADIGAAIGAALNLIGEKMTPEEIAEIASSIEPTDSVFMEDNVIFNPVKGKVKEKLGYIDDMKVLLLEPNKYLNTVDLRKNRMYKEAKMRNREPVKGKVKEKLGYIDDMKVLLLEPNKYLNTVDLRKNRMYKEAKMRNREIIENAFKMLKKGFTEKDREMIGRACTASSLANENICKKEYLHEIIEVSDKCGGFGVNVAHSGTIVGILVDKDFDCTEMIAELKRREIDKVYSDMYTLDIIKGGIRFE